MTPYLVLVPARLPLAWNSYLGCVGECVRGGVVVIDGFTDVKWQL